MVIVLCSTVNILRPGDEATFSARWQTASISAEIFYMQCLDLVLSENTGRDLSVQCHKK